MTYEFHTHIYYVDHLFPSYTINGMLVMHVVHESLRLSLSSPFDYTVLPVVNSSPNSLLKFIRIKMLLYVLS